MYGREAEVGNNPEQQNTTQLCRGACDFYIKMTSMAVGEGIPSQLNFSPICFYTALVFLSLLADLKMDKGETKQKGKRKLKRKERIHLTTQNIFKGNAVV